MTQRPPHSCMYSSCGMISLCRCHGRMSTWSGRVRPIQSGAWIGRRWNGGSGEDW